MAGNLYCQVIAVCWELFDLRRAREWTAATERWCEHFDSAVMFSGICRMHRVQLRQVAGEWDLAAAEARIVCTELVGMNTQVVAEGYYLLGELLRLRGDFVGAEAAYLRAHELGRDPQPGLALLTAQTDAGGAGLASLRTALATHNGAEYSRAPLLLAVVDLAVDVPDLEAAGEASEQLTAMAHQWQSHGPGRRGGPCAWGGPGRRGGCRRGGNRLFARPSAAGRSSRRRTPALGRGCCWRRRTRRWETTAPRPASWTSPSGRWPGSTPWSTFDGYERLRPGAELPGGLTMREAEILRAGGHGRHQQAGRRCAGDQREDRSPPSREHLLQARCLDQDRGRRLGAQRRAVAGSALNRPAAYIQRCTGRSGEVAHLGGSEDRGLLSTVERAGASPALNRQEQP